MLPDMLDQLLAGHDLSPEDLTKVLMVKGLHDFPLDQTVERPDVGDHAGHGINGTMDRHKAVPLASLIAILHRRKR